MQNLLHTGISLPLLPYSQANTAMTAHAGRRGNTLVPIKLTTSALFASFSYQ